MAERVRIGELLVETGLITREQLERALELQKNDSRRLGEILVSQKMVSEFRVTQVLSQQLSVPWVSLEYVDFSRQLLNLVSSQTAQEHTLVPIYVRRSKHRQETLYVAIEDPSNQEALDEVAERSGLPVKPMIAPPSDIRAAVRAYYLGLPPESTPTPPPAPSSRPPVASSSAASRSAPPKNPSAPPAPSAAPKNPSAPPAPSAAPKNPSAQPAPSAAPKNPSAPPAPSAAPKSPSAPPAPSAAPRDPSSPLPPTSAPVAPPELSQDRTSSLPPPEHATERSPDSVDIGARTSDLPTPSKSEGDGPKMITITMLDGTEMRLPAAGSSSPVDEGSSELTARDLVEALRAGGVGQDVSEVLGTEVNWQKMFAALLSLMLKKHLILDWEFVRELKR